MCQDFQGGTLRKSLPVWLWCVHGPGGRAVWNTCKVPAESSVVVFGLGAVGLSVIQGAKMAGASKIIAVDINPTKFDMARTWGH